MAPRAGAETQGAIRDKAVEMKKRAGDAVSGVLSKARAPVSSTSATGTEG